MIKGLIVIFEFLILGLDAHAGAFVKGYNQAWFADSYGTGLTSQFNENYVRANLAAHRMAGGQVVRLWLFEGRQDRQIADLVTNLNKVFAIARAEGLQVYLTLFDGNEMTLNQSPQRDDFLALLNNLNGEMDQFFLRSMLPLLGLLERNRDVVFGLDLMNELQAPVYNDYWGDYWDGARRWVKDFRKAIQVQSPWLRTTVSSGWDSASWDIAQGLFAGIGLDFYDVHAYSDEGVIDRLNELCRRASHDELPIYLGEFGQKTRKSDDALQARVTENFLQQASASCLSGALAWRLDAHEKWWNYLRPDRTWRPATEILRKHPTLVLDPTSFWTEVFAFPNRARGFVKLR